MRILIINEKLLEGGAEIYVHNLRKLLSEKHEVFLLCFDNEFEEKIKNIENLNNIVNIKVRSGLSAGFNKIFFNYFLYKKIRDVLKKIKPDKIIVNNIFYSPDTQLKALKGYEIYQIVHDYSIVCPKATCIRNNLEVCKGYKHIDCLKECRYHKSKVILFIKLLLTKKMEKLRKKYVKKLISPSKLLNDYLLEFNYDSVCINNPIEINQTVNKYVCNNDIKRYIYVGAVNERKGIFKFIEYFDEFSKGKELELCIVGSVWKDSEKKLKNILDKNKRIKYLGYKKHSEILTEIEKSDFIVVPSVCMENYPTTVLEGMLSKTLVLASDRGGMVEMLKNDRGFIFDILDEKSVMGVLEQTYRINSEEYKKVVSEAYSYVINNNSFESYKNKLFETIMKKDDIKND